MYIYAHICKYNTQKDWDSSAKQSFGKIPNPEDIQLRTGTAAFTVELNT